MFSALNPKVCPYCQEKRLYVLSSYRVQIYNVSDIKSKPKTYSVKFDINAYIDNENTDTNTDEDIVLSGALCNIMKLPSISIRYSVDDPYSSRPKKCKIAKSCFETPITVELRVYSPNRAYVLLDSEDDKIFEYIASQYKQRGWTVLDLRQSGISFTKIIRRFLRKKVVPRLQNDVVRKDIVCLTENDNDNNDSNGDSSDNNYR